MKTVRFIVILFILGVLLMFGLIGALAEPMSVDFNAFEFIAIKAVSFGVVFIAYKGFLILMQAMKELRKEAQHNKA